MPAQKSEIQNNSPIMRIEGFELQRKNTSHNKCLKQQSEIDKRFTTHLEYIKNAFKIS
jgi:hypothetical protein